MTIHSPRANSTLYLFLSLLCALILAGSTVALPTDSATITFRKVFKSSSPEFVEIKIRDTGPCTYDIRSLNEDPDPQSFEVGASLRAKITELTGELQNFKGLELDARRRIANLGQKTFRYERGTETNEVTFNYTINGPAGELLLIFEGLTRQQEHLRTLQHRLKYDRLGLQNALLSFEADFNHKVLPEPERLLPVLEQIAADTRVVDLSRQRARGIIDRIRNPR